MNTQNQLNIEAADNLVKADKDYLSPDELKAFKALSNGKACLQVVRSYAVIVAAMALAVAFPNPFVLLLAVILLGGSQMSLGVLLHDCSHRVMFKNAGLNDFVGNWLGGIPMLIPLPYYRQYHFIHHTKTGTQNDPDLSNISHYPVTKQSMARKLMRDFTGLSGIKVLLGIMLYVNTGFSGNSVTLGKNQSDMTRSKQIRFALYNYFQIIVVQAVFALSLYWMDVLWLYGLWWAAFLFAYPFILRVRQIGEHGAMPILASKDVRNNTRTTHASWWEKLLFAPNQVNFHCEHHLYPTVPSYHLKRLHSVLKERGFYRHHPDTIEPGYWSVLKRAASKAR